MNLPVVKNLLACFNMYDKAEHLHMLNSPHTRRPSRLPPHIADSVACSVCLGLRVQMVRACLVVGHCTVLVFWFCKDFLIILLSITY